MDGQDTSNCGKAKSVESMLPKIKQAADVACFIFLPIKDIRIYEPQRHNVADAAHKGTTKV
jgi:hypothetical protein